MRLFALILIVFAFFALVHKGSYLFDLFFLGVITDIVEWVLDWSFIFERTHEPLILQIKRVFFHYFLWRLWIVIHICMGIWWFFASERKINLSFYHDSLATSVCLGFRVICQLFLLLKCRTILTKRMLVIPQNFLQNMWEVLISFLQTRIRWLLNLKGLTGCLSAGRVRFLIPSIFIQF